MKIDLNWNKEFAKVREGKVLLDNGNHKLYKCPAGKQTIGYGWNLEDRGLPENLAIQLLNIALNESESECERNIASWNKHNFARKSVLVDMVYNMGWSRFSTFVKFLAALDDQDYDKAADEMADSRWYKQTGLRAKTLRKQMRSGEYQ